MMLCLPLLPTHGEYGSGSANLQLIWKNIWYFTAFGTDNCNLLQEFVPSNTLLKLLHVEVKVYKTLSYTSLFQNVFGEKKSFIISKGNTIIPSGMKKKKQLKENLCQCLLVNLARTNLRILNTWGWLCNIINMKNGACPREPDTYLLITAW